MKIKKYLLNLINKLQPNIEGYFGFYFISVNILLCVLNSNSAMMGGIMDYYVDFSEVIKNGFDLSFAKMNAPTFPMWGYGWLLIITKNRLGLFLIQGFFSYVIINNALLFLKNYLSYSDKMLFLLKSLILLSFSFISINYTVSPYSLSINLLIISLMLYYKGLINSSYRYIFYSALIFGIVLNFRSDYLYFVFFLIFASTIILKSFKIFKLNSIWTIVVFSSLIPWLIYTKHVVNNPILTSTNSGHVFYIGLGNLPNNKWGISTSDHDTRMYKELKAEFGPSANSLNYREDEFLKKRFLELVKQEPLEYFKKIAYTSISTIISGIYVPEFYNLRSNCKGGCKVEFTNDLSSRPISSLFENVSKFILYSLTYFSICFGVLILFFSYMVLPVVLYHNIRSKNIFLILCCLILIYQWLICTFAYQMRLYNTYSYFWALLIIVDFVKRKQLIQGNPLEDANSPVNDVVRG